MAQFNDNLFNFNELLGEIHKKGNISESFLSRGISFNRILHGDCLRLRLLFLNYVTLKMLLYECECVQRFNLYCQVHRKKRRGESAKTPAFDNLNMTSASSDSEESVSSTRPGRTSEWTETKVASFVRSVFGICDLMNSVNWMKLMFWA